MNQQDNQSIISEGVSEVALAGMLDDLTVQNAEAIKGGPVELVNDFVAQDKYVTFSVSRLRG